MSILAMIPNNGQESPAETLARSILSRIESVSAKLRDLEADIRQLWVEFEKLKDGETILGCRTKKEFCERKLNRSPRTVQYLLAGQSNPADRPRSELSSPALSAAEELRKPYPELYEKVVSGQMTLEAARLTVRPAPDEIYGFASVYLGTDKLDDEEAVKRLCNENQCPDWMARRTVRLYREHEIRGLEPHRRTIFHLGDIPQSESYSPRPFTSNRQLRHQAVIAANPEMKNATPKELDAMAYRMHLENNPPAEHTTQPQTVENAPHASPVEELRQLISERRRQRPSDPSLDRRKNRDDIRDFNELQDYGGLIFQLGYEEVRRSTNHFITHGSLLDSAFSWGKARLAEEKTAGIPRHSRKSPNGQVHIDELPPEAQRRVLESIGSAA